MDKDPVCGMDVDPSTAKDTADYQRKTYYFCAPSCRQAFEADPARYLDSDLKGGNSRSNSTEGQSWSPTSRFSNTRSCRLPKRLASVGRRRLSSLSIGTGSPISPDGVLSFYRSSYQRWSASNSRSRLMNSEWPGRSRSS